MTDRTERSLTVRNGLLDRASVDRTEAERTRLFQVEFDFMGRVLAQVEPASTPVPTQACVHVDDEELQAVQDERDVHHLFVERCRS